jgi:hypothetical protein
MGYDGILGINGAEGPGELKKARAPTPRRSSGIEHTRAVVPRRIPSVLASDFNSTNQGLLAICSKEDSHVNNIN